MKLSILLALGLLISQKAFGAQTLPPLEIPQGVGVNIHFVKGHEKDLDLIAAAGFKFIRMDFAWGGIERKKEQYDWSAYDELTTNLEKRGLRAIYILDYSNGLYEETVISKNPVTGTEQRDTASPQHPESVQAFARWAAAAASHYKGRGIIWEIWNEPNISFWKPKPDVHQYLALAKATIKEVRKADPNAIIIAPATSEVPVKFLNDFLAAGVLNDLSAISVHPYRSYKKGPETALEDYTKLREIIAQHAQNEQQKQIPILSGEWGYASHEKGVSLETQAAFAVRQQLANLLFGIPISIWYDWKNDGPDRAEREHNFGTVTESLDPKPAYKAISTMTHELKGFRIDKRINTGNDKVFALLMKNGKGQTRLALWTSGESHVMRIPLKLLNPDKIQAVTGLTGMADPFSPAIEGEQLVVSVEALPKYIRFE